MFVKTIWQPLPPLLEAEAKVKEDLFFDKTREKFLLRLRIFFLPVEFVLNIIGYVFSK